MEIRSSIKNKTKQNKTALLYQKILLSVHAENGYAAQTDCETLLKVTDCDKAIELCKMVKEKYEIDTLVAAKKHFEELREKPDETFAKKWKPYQSIDSYFWHNNYQTKLESYVFQNKFSVFFFGFFFYK